MSSGVIMVLMIIIFVEAFWRWFQPVQIESTVTGEYGDQVLVPVKEGCEETE